LRNILTSLVSNQGLTCIQVKRDGIAVVRITRDTSHNDAEPIISDCLFRAVDKQENLASSLKALNKELGLKRSRCTTVLPEQNYKLLLTDKPNVPDNELAAALSWQVKDLIDQPVDETTFEVFPAPPAADITAPESSYVVAARNDAIQDCITPLANANINLHCIDIREMALRNLTMLMSAADESVIMLWLSEHYGSLIIARNGDIYLSRPISMGLDDLGDGPHQSQNIDALILEIQRSLDYHESHYQTNQISKIMLAPGLTKRCAALASAIQETLAIETGTFNLDRYIKHTTELPENWQADFFIPIGAALRHEGNTA